MGLDCLSTVSILRCEQFSQIQTVGLLIPTIIEVIFSTALLFTNRSSTKRQHLWITAEGWTYFALTLIEVIMHGVPAGRMNQATMKGLDIFIGATSVLPIFFYMFFIFIFLRADFMDSLPSRFRTTLAVLLLLFIPTVAALSELASFLGVCYRVGSGIKSTFPLVVGFRTAKDEVVWTFFTSVTLALLTIYQIIAFCLSFFRLTRVFLHQKKIEVDEKDEAHHFRGIAWIAGGFKLGAIETVVGFTDMGFGTAVTRRLLRMLARAFLCIGIARGVDIVEDFEKVRQEMSSWRQTDFRRSRLRELISNPRFSTFRQLTPTATAFHTAPRAPQVTSSLYERHAEQNAFKAAPKQSPEKEPSRLVSVKFDNVGTPRLDLGRFSSFGFPLSLHRAEPLPPPISVWSSDSSPQQAPSSREVVSQVPSPAQAPSVLSNLVITELGHETQLKSFSPVSPTHAKSNRKYSRAESSYSVKSWDTSFSAVRELTSQFPTLPSSVVPPAEQPQPADFWDDSSVTSPNSSASDRPKESRDTNTLRIPEAARVTETSPVPILRTNETASSPSTVTDESVASQKRERGVSFLDVGDPTPTRARSVNPAEWIDYDSIPPAKRRSVLHPIAERNDEEAPSVMEDEGGVRESGASFGTYHISWLRNPVSIQEERRQARRMIKKPDGARVMSVGSAPMRSRPSVVQKEYTRGSLHLTPITIPPNSQTNTELVQGSYDTVGGKSVLRDSEVLGVEDGRYNRQMEERGYI